MVLVSQAAVEEGRTSGRTRHFSVILRNVTCACNHYVTIIDKCQVLSEHVILNIVKVEKHSILIVRKKYYFLQEGRIPL